MSNIQMMYYTLHIFFKTHGIAILCINSNQILLTIYKSNKLLC